MDFKEKNENELDSDQGDDVLWSIEDDTMFQPCGLISHSSSSNSKTKSVFVTWNEYYLLNYRFKKSAKTNRMAMTKVRIPLPRNTQLRSIHMLEYNTLLLMLDGRVHCFGSIKSLHNIPWLKGVRAFAQTPAGFCVIRHDEQTQRLLLETYDDLPSLSKGNSTVQHSYDITYDEENIFQCDWQSDQYTLLSVTVEEQHEPFMQFLFGKAAVIDQQLYILSIAGHIFVLIPQHNEVDTAAELAYHVELLCIYASTVSFIRLLPAQNLCLVYLSCGSIDIWYVSNLLGIKQRQMHYTGAEWLDYDASCENGDFYYTDGEELVRLKFYYDAQLDDCQVDRSVKAVPGMQACTWVQQIEQLVCLSDNNIFYRIAFSTQDTANVEDVGLLTELTTAEIARLHENAQVLEQYEQQPEQLLKAIQGEHEKQQLVAVARQTAHLKLSAALEFQRRLPQFGAEELLLLTAKQTQLHSSGVYALLALDLGDSEFLMRCNNWQLLAYQGHEAHIFRVPTEVLINHKCRIVVPLCRELNMSMPEFTLKLAGFVELQTETTAVVINILVKQSSLTYSSLFSGQLGAVNLYNEPSIADLFSKEKILKVRSVIQHKIKAPSSLNLDQIATLCNATSKLKEDLLELYFLNSPLSISSSVEDGNTVLTLKSEDAAAIYQFKQHLYLNVCPEEVCTVQDAAAKEKIMKFQNDIERFYGTHISENLDSNSQSHLESLQLKYKTIRSTVL